MMRKLPVVLGSLLGAFAIHGVLVACSAGGTTLSGTGGEGTAHADPATVPATCTQWEVKTVAPTKYSETEVNYTDHTGKAQTSYFPSLGATTLEAGWEPIGVLFYSTLVRRCVK